MHDFDDNKRRLRAGAPRTRRRVAPWIELVAWLISASVVGTWILLYATTDYFWIGTLLAFGPRWVLLVPVGAVAVAAAARNGLAVGDRGEAGGRTWSLSRVQCDGGNDTRNRRNTCRFVAIMVATGWVLLFPVMGFCVPERLWRLGAAEGTELRVLTLNTDGRADPERIRALIDMTQPSVVALQEYNADEQWLSAFGEGWHVRRHGELLVASRYEITASTPVDSAALRPGRSPALLCRLATSGGDVDFVTVHLRSPREGLSAVLHKRLAGIAELEANAERRRVESLAVSNWLRKKGAAVIVAGDFNLTVESRIYREFWGGYSNAFSEAGLGFGATFFSRWHGVRIDHVLAGDDWRCRRAWVCPDVGSAHRPLMAIFTRRNGAGNSRVAAEVAQDVR